MLYLDLELGNFRGSDRNSIINPLWLWNCEILCCNYKYFHYICCEWLVMWMWNNVKMWLFWNLKPGTGNWSYSSLKSLSTFPHSTSSHNHYSLRIYVIVMGISDIYYYISNNCCNTAVLTRPSFLYLPTSTWGVSLDNGRTELCCNRANTLDFGAHQIYAPMAICTNVYRIWMNSLPTTN